MTTQPLPERPDLRQLKRRAKELLAAARAADRGALRRFRILPAFGGHTDEELEGAPLALHDAQSVVAREHGFPSWKALRARVEELTLDPRGAAAAFVEAATDGRSGRAARLLERHPRLGEDPHAALLLGDVAAVERRLAAESSWATEAGGPRSWEPLLYVCHTSLEFGPEGRAAGLVEIARLLVEAGADPDARFPWLHHGVRRSVLWGATRVTRHLPLAELLLASGADPDDGVTLPLAASAGDVPALDVLLAHGADPDQAWATDGSPSLHSVLTWGTDPAGIRWLLEHGADPDAPFQENGETALHVVARRWGVDVARWLADRGADLDRPRKDGRTPYAIAELNGNRAVADWLADRGVSTDLARVDRLVGACSRADRRAVDELMEAHPELPSELTADHYASWYRAAEQGDAAALELMLACGFDPARPDGEIGKTALHAAAMGGWPEAVGVLLDHGAPVAARDDEFHATPIVWAAEAARRRASGDGRDHTEVARLLVEAGSSLEWDPPTDEPAEDIRAVLIEWGRTLR